MKSRFPSFAVFTALALCWSGTGCTSEVGRKAQNSDGFIDFVGALVGRSRPDVVPVERVSNRMVEIVTAHAEAGPGGTTYVSGVLKRGFEMGDDGDAHIDVQVLAADRRPVAAFATDFTPRPIPATYRSVVGRSYYVVRLPFVPQPGATIQVLCHRTRLADCPHRHPLASLPNGGSSATLVTRPRDAATG